jgi:hypothetical protein
MSENLLSNFRLYAPLRSSMNCLFNRFTDTETFLKTF